MNRPFWISLFAATSLMGAPTSFSPLSQSNQGNLTVQNRILARVNDQTISVLDVMKRMDLLFLKNFPHLADSQEARYQFYMSGWRSTLQDMIDTELLVADAEEKQVKLTDGEIREELEKRYGPNVTLNLDKLHLSYEEAWKHVKTDMLVERMTWFFIHSKAIQAVTPGVIRDAYRAYLVEKPAYTELHYRVLSFKAESPEQELQAAAAVANRLKEANESPETLSLTDLAPEGVTLQLSSEYIAKESELSDAHRIALSSLEIGQYSSPHTQSSRLAGKSVTRIFYLASKQEHPAPSFEEMADQLKNKLLQEAVARESNSYLSKLRKRYGYDPVSLNETLPADLEPFSFQF